MRIDRRIAERHWEAAAADQIAERLEAEGYKVQRQGRFAELRADLIARKGKETIVYEFKLPNEGGDDWSRAVSQLRNRAVERGARFHLVFVKPPREARIEVEGIETALETALREHGSRELNDISEDAKIKTVSDVEIDSIEIRPDHVELAGHATLQISLDDGGRDLATDSLPLSFDVILDRNGRIEVARKLSVDTSSWIGDWEDLDY